MSRISISDTELLLSDDKPTEFLLAPLIARGTVTMIYAPAGVGKTHFVNHIAAAMAGGGEFLGFKAPQAYRGVVVDSELGKAIVRLRWTDVVNFCGFDIPAGSINFVCGELCERQICPRISEPLEQKLYDAELNGRDFIVLDNYNGLIFRKSRETDDEVWARTEAWFRQLKARGISVVLVHHTGKSGEQLGTSQRTNFVDIQIRLTRPFDHQPQQGVRFEVNFEKVRVDPRVYEPRDFLVTMSFANGGYTWTYEYKDAFVDRKVRELDALGMQPAQIATAIGVGVFRVQSILKSGIKWP